MAGINIIDGFNVNITEPVDYRLVVPTTIARDAIQYKYNGLPVFVEADRKTYVWNTGTLDWDISFSGSPDVLAVINSAGNGITASIIRHGANGITFLNTASYITTLGTMSIYGATGVNIKAGNVIVRGGYASGGLGAIGGDVYVNGGVGSAPGNLYLGYDNTFGAVGKVGIGSVGVFDSGITFQVAPTTAFNSMVRLKALSESNLGMVFNSTLPYTGVASAAYIKSNNVFSTTTTPDYTWYGDTTTGIYHPAANTFGISTNGVANMVATPTNVTMAANGSTGLSLTPTNSILTYGGNTVSVSSTKIVLSTSGASVSIAATAFGVYIPSFSVFVDKFKVTTNDIYAYVHNNGPLGIGDSGNSATPWNYQSVASGQFAMGASIGDLVGVSVVSASPANWMRVGNVVHVTGMIDLTVTNARCELSLKLPINSYFGDNNYWQLAGIGKIVQAQSPTSNQNTGGGDVISIHASGNLSGRNKAYFKFWPTSTSNNTGRTIVYSFQYIVGNYPDSPSNPGPSPGVAGPVSF